MAWMVVPVFKVKVVCRAKVDRVWCMLDEVGMHCSHRVWVIGSGDHSDLELESFNHYNDLGQTNTET
jgi:hypothetical protein